MTFCIIVAGTLQVGGKQRPPEIPPLKVMPAVKGPPTNTSTTVRPFSRVNWPLDILGEDGPGDEFCRVKCRHTCQNFGGLGVPVVRVPFLGMSFWGNQKDTTLV